MMFFHQFNELFQQNTLNFLIYCVFALLYRAENFKYIESAVQCLANLIWLDLHSYRLSHFNLSNLWPFHTWHDSLANKMTSSWLNPSNYWALTNANWRNALLAAVNESSSEGGLSPVKKLFPILTVRLRKSWAFENRNSQVT